MNRTILSLLASATALTAILGGIAAPLASADGGQQVWVPLPAAPNPSNPVIVQDSFLALVAQNVGVSPETLDSVFAASGYQLVDLLRADGQITLAQADQLRAEITAGGTPFVGDGTLVTVNNPLGFTIDPAVTAYYLGITSDTMFAELNAGYPLSAIAAARGVTRDDLKAIIFYQAVLVLNQQVADGSITQEVANARYALLVANIDSTIDSVDGSLGLFGVSTTSSLEDAFLAIVASNLGYTAANFESLLAYAGRQLTDQLFAAGLISTTQANALYASIASGGHPFLTGATIASTAAASGVIGTWLDPGLLAAYLGISVGTLQENLVAGTTIAELADAGGLDRYSLQSFIAQQVAFQLNNAVLSGQITTYTAEALYNTALNELDAFVDTRFYRWPFGTIAGRAANPYPFEDPENAPPFPG